MSTNRDGQTGEIPSSADVNNINIQALIQILQSLQSPSTSTVSANLQFESFKEGEENFHVYKQRLENFFQLRNITDGVKKVQVLINCIGTQHYQLLTSLTAPELPNTKTYEELMKLLENHLCPVPNEVTEQHKFSLRVQHEGETVANYVAELKRLTTFCNFKCVSCEASTIDTHLRAQFIRGVRDSDIRERLLQEKKQKFEDVIQVALAIESSKTQSRTMQSVHQVRTYHSKGNTPAAYITRKTSAGNTQHMICYRCGRQNHKSSDCTTDRRTLSCTSCGRKGHVTSICMNRGGKSNPSRRHMQNPHHRTAHALQIDEDYTSSDEEIQTLNSLQLHTKSGEQGKFFISLKIQSKPYSMEFDTGSAITTMGEDVFRKLYPRLELLPTAIHLRVFDKHVFKAVGEAKVHVEYQNKKFTGTIYIVPSGLDSVCGREWINKLGLFEIKQINSIQNAITDSTNFPNKILHDYSDLFQSKIGTIPKIKGLLKLREGVPPIYIKPRPVPYALKNLIEDEINRLEKCGIFEKVAHSDWGTPIVPVIKSPTELRLCADYKVTLNQCIVNDKYPIPKIDDLYQQLKYGEYYCVFDIHKAYLHLEMTDESALMQTVSTHKGLYKVRRLMFGVKTAPNIWQRFMDDHIMRGLEGTVCFFDDIIVTGKSLEETDQRARAVLDRLRSYDLHINLRKSKMFQKSVNYLGHIIDKNGLHKNQEKIQAILDIDSPTNVTELRQFLGMGNYYNKFIPNLATKLHELHKLLQKDTTFNWTQKCDDTFRNIKHDIMSENVLAPFDDTLPLVLATDASPYGLSAILSHITQDGEKPIAFASRSLTKSESNYSQIDKEATAIYWGLHKFYNYCYGREFTLITDNKPLTSILSPNKCLPVLTAQRILHYAQFLSGFNYKIIYRNTKDHTNVDYLSRNPRKINEAGENIREVHMFQLTDFVLPITSKVIANETRKDQELCLVYNNLQSGRNLNNTTFKGKDDELMLQDGCIYRGIRIIIPRQLRKQVLAELHTAHVGIVKMKALARSYCYWIGIDNDIEHLVRSCRDCATVANEPTKVPVHPWESPFMVWQRIHIDFAGPFMEHYFLIVVDAKSKWLEVVPMKSITSLQTIKALREMFARFGLPTTLVSDNGTNFTSKEFSNFIKSNGITHKFTAPAHPATNGQAERYVQTVKNGLRSAANDLGDLHVKLHRLLMQYRKIPNATTGKSPAEMLLKHNLRTRLDLIKYTDEKVSSKNTNLKSIRSFVPGDRVQIRYYLNKTTKWKFGTIVQRDGELHYTVQVDGQYCRRHIDQIKATDVDEGVATTKSIFFELPISENIHDNTNHPKQNITPGTNEQQHISTPDTNKTNSPIPIPEISSQEPDSQPQISEPMNPNTSPSTSIQKQTDPEKPMQTPKQITPKDVRKSNRVRRPPNRMNL